MQDDILALKIKSGTTDRFQRIRISDCPNIRKIFRRLDNKMRILQGDGNGYHKNDKRGRIN